MSKIIRDKPSLRGPIEASTKSFPWYPTSAMRKAVAQRLAQILRACGADYAEPSWDLADELLDAAYKAAPDLPLLPADHVMVPRAQATHRGVAGGRDEESSLGPQVRDFSETQSAFGVMKDYFFGAGITEPELDAMSQAHDPLTWDNVLLSAEFLQRRRSAMRSAIRALQSLRKDGSSPKNPSPPEVERWRPISEAPRDGTVVIVWNGSATWASSRRLGVPGQGGQPTYGHDWVMQGAWTHRPTHWQPLPSPPKDPQQ